MGVCLCVCERERKRGGGIGEREREEEREREKFLAVDLLGQRLCECFNFTKLSTIGAVSVYTPTISGLDSCVMLLSSPFSGGFRAGM